jgi:ribosomal protein S1
MASPLKPNATTAEINEFLAQVRIPNFRVHPKLVEFNDAKDRQRKITLLHNKLIAKGLPEDAAQSQSEELANADTLSVGITSLTQKGLVLMLAGLDEKDLQQNLSSSDSTTHVMLVFLKERKVSILFYSIFIIQMLIAQIALYL